MPSPNTIQDRRRDHVGGRQSGGQYRGGDDEGDDAQPLGFQNLAGKRVFELRRQSAPRLTLNEIADKCLHGVRQSKLYWLSAGFSRGSPGFLMGEHYSTASGKRL